MPYEMNNPPKQIQELPKEAQKIWINAFNNSLEQGNSELSAVRIAWSAVKRVYEKKYEAPSKPEEPLKWKPKTSKTKLYSMNMEPRVGYYDTHGYYNLQFSYIDDGGVSEKVFKNWVANHNSTAFGREVLLTMNHSFVLDSGNPNNKIYGWLVSNSIAKNLEVEPIYLKGQEVWGVFKLNELGEEVIRKRTHIAASPGWLPFWQHELTDEVCNDTLFEVSLVGIPAQPMMNPIVSLRSVELKGEKEETIIMADENIKIKNAETANAILETQVSVAKMKLLEEANIALNAKLADLEVELRTKKITTWAEALLPSNETDNYKLFKSELPEVIKFALSLDEPTLEAFKSVIQGLPGMQVDTKVHGTKEVPVTPEVTSKKMTEDEIAVASMMLAKGNPNWSDETKRHSLLHQAEDSIRAKEEKIN